MPEAQTSSETQPIEDSVAKVGNELAVGEDLGFQRKWWRFERGVWIVFALIVLLDVLGAFGRGPLANAKLLSPAHLMNIEYERIERFSTPSILTVHFSPAAIHDGKVQLWVSESVVKTLGNQRIVPQPASSMIGNGGILYTFQSSPLPDSVQFALQPAYPGVSHIELRVPGESLANPADKANLTVAVMP